MKMNQIKKKRYRRDWYGWNGMDGTHQYKAFDASLPTLSHLLSVYKIKIHITVRYHMHIMLQFLSIIAYPFLIPSHITCISLVIHICTTYIRYDYDDYIYMNERWWCDEESIAEGWFSYCANAYAMHDYSEL